MNNSANRVAGVISKSCKNPRSFFRWSMDSCPEFLMRLFFLIQKHMANLDLTRIHRCIQAWKKSLKIFLLQKVKTSQLRSKSFQVIILNRETSSKSQSISQLQGLFQILKPSQNIWTLIACILELVFCLMLKSGKCKLHFLNVPKGSLWKGDKTQRVT